ncbi:hypothetical protein TSUD_320220 [Trifolium subterraneum]|uniref:Uncharacterized protein n=1 Tax=Trifolium subterraneum TaxID=3900 RepID=A0A2Z6NPI1_TRISU|nr:hypothetical protein TSUD_320220 [Trifolium subterraneum]
MQHHLLHLEVKIEVVVQVYVHEHFLQPAYNNIERKKNQNWSRYLFRREKMLMNLYNLNLHLKDEIGGNVHEPIPEQQPQSQPQNETTSISTTK